ncbi:MAG: tRNA (guanosine(37)-N1)-methyltransferase TrmD [Chlamydiia bacterium]|nr:tRNA (guanosine(37)-N1)-methyltransferase TrmD [Chlamydiia bacterium]
MRFDIISLFPSYFKSPFNESLIKKALEKALIEIGLVDIRDFADNKWRKVDDRPYGGGPGMVICPEPVEKAVLSVKNEGSRVIYLSPQGSPLTAEKARSLAKEEHLVLLCGHYEGIDERALEAVVDEELSIGDYVLTSGCPAAVVVVDAVSRFVPGVIGHEEATSQDSFESGHFDCPHYTRPEEYNGKKVPEVLLSGDHKKIGEWRQIKGLEKTRRVRPDLKV